MCVALLKLLQLAGDFQKPLPEAKEALLEKLATNIKNNMFSTKYGCLFEIVNATL